MWSWSWLFTSWAHSGLVVEFRWVSFREFRASGSGGKRRGERREVRGLGLSPGPGCDLVPCFFSFLLCTVDG